MDTFKHTSGGSTQQASDWVSHVHRGFFKRYFDGSVACPGWQVNSPTSSRVLKSEVGRMLSTIRKSRVPCSVSVSCVTCRACEAVRVKFSSGVVGVLASVSCCCSWVPLLRWCSTGVTVISHSFVFRVSLSIYAVKNCGHFHTQQQKKLGIRAQGESNECDT